MTLLPLFVALTGCYKIFQTDLPQGHIKPVLNALLVRDSTTKVRISQSSLPGDRRVHYRKDAIVKCYGDDMFWGMMRLREEPNDTFFTAASLPIGKRIRITAEVPGFPMVEGESVMPLPVPDMDTELRVSTPRYGPEKLNLLVRLHDPGGVRNYYRMRLYPVYPNGGGRDTYYAPIALTYDGLENYGFLGDGDGTEVFFDDEVFDGRTPVLRFTAESYMRMPEYEVELSQLSDEAYRYLRSVELQRRRETNDVAEKVKIFSNIRNGLGIVGGMAIRRWRIKPL